ncbi:MAG TPA: cupredoxin domain-containing protein [Candidatus Limnocylindria bacterium]|nr:cupredoxin domain-containing protein [Candidatus Limnocylindria bacterium]
MPRPYKARPRRTWPRAMLFTAIAFAIVIAAIRLLQPEELATEDGGPVDVTVRIDMAGFTPPDIEIPAGRSVRLRIVNPDNTHHADGGGWHQLAVPGIGLDARIAPLSTRVVELPARAAGEYPFYCDVCCGGKENPSMRGTLKIGA